ncbi:glycosyltransferase family 2 protein [Anditalea andensis]|uniref:Glycosyltransferase 2-like domain-containing protein n=1 Tax=Anditalea andensis TaxID=1048983 RepID=A0A074KYA9_9BACT|nr:glycosyltransferase family 2 protein [Anditalea andensis]KEO72578.1 hypothetical protein EL17_17730 [Anditalea andensis]
MKISLVLPVYNVEKYLARCIESCLHQDIAKDTYEIIIVDDGSTDNSNQIASEYEDTYSNIRLIRQDNKGLSGARNTGLNHANGKYVWFIDSDDWIEHDILSDIIGKLDEKNADALIVNFYKVDQNDNITGSAIENLNYLDNHIYTGTEYFKNRPGDFLNSWRYICNTEFLRQHHLSFYEGIVHEDNEHTPKLLYHVEKLITYNKPVYAHLIRSGSIMTTFNPKKIESWYKIFESMKSFRSQIPSCSPFRIYLNQYILQQYSNYLTDRNQYDLGNEDIVKLQRLKPLEKWPNMNFKYHLKYKLISNLPVQYSKMISTFNKFTKN